MSRHESDREDLLREATALVERAELQVAGFAEPIVIGFRRDGAASVFLGADPVYQFNAANELRRAFVSGLLYKAEHGKLVELRRERSERETALLRKDLSRSETAALLLAMHGKLVQLAAAMSLGTYAVHGQWPAEVDVCDRIRQWLTALPKEIRLADRPNVAR